MSALSCADQPLALRFAAIIMHVLPVKFALNCAATLASQAAIEPTLEFV